MASVAYNVIFNQCITVAYLFSFALLYVDAITSTDLRISKPIEGSIQVPEEV